MRTPWLRTLLLGLLIGPAPALADATADTVADPPCEDPFARPETDGQSVSGEEYLVWDEYAREARAWAAELTHGCGQAGASLGWRGVAQRTAGGPAVLGNDIVEEMAAWGQAPEEGKEEAGLLGLVLCLLPSIDRTYLISSWATSPSERIRRDLAQALSVPFEATGVPSAIEHLRSDPSAEIRSLATLAAASRGLPRA